MPKKALITDVSERANVSTATVSRILSGRRTKQDDTAQRVRAIAKELNYSVNYAARTLRNDKSYTIGLIVPKISNPFFSELAEEVEKAANSAKKQLLICASNQDTLTERKRLSNLLSRHVDGIIIVPSHETASSTGIDAAAQQVPVVQVDQKSKSSMSDWIGIDDAAAMFDILQHLKDQGAKTVVFFGSTTVNSSGKDRFHSFLTACKQLDLQTIENTPFLGDYSINWGRKAAENLLRTTHAKSHATGQIPRVDAIVCANDLIAFGALEQLTSQGIRIPTEIMITGFDDTFVANFCSPSLTTVTQPIQQIAREAIHLIEVRQQDSIQPHMQMLLSARLQIRDSTQHFHTDA